MNASRYRRRRVTNRIGLFLSGVAMAAGLAGLTWILWTLFYNGLSAFSIDFFTKSTPAPGSSGGGLANAIVGSLMMVGVSTLVATPIGILAGIYLAEYGAKSHFAAATRFVVDIMLSAPSIVIGLFVYAIAVALKAVKGGVVTGVLLSIARMIGETAPLLFTALNNQFFSADMGKPMSNLPVVIFNFAMSPYEDWQQLAWGGAALIALVVLGINIIARVMFRDPVRR